MKITDEMVEVACKAWAGVWGHAWPTPTTSPIEEAAQLAQRETIRATIAAVAPLIAKAENEACAEVVTAGYQGMSQEHRILLVARATAIRARHPTPTPTGKTEQENA